jgi:ubiquinone/menaquinone biosynthesis C-methylase UbiE
MKLNSFEFGLLTGALRRLVQEQIDIRQWRKLGALDCPEGDALDIGCGQGHGIRLAVSKFGVSKVDAFDTDERMLERSRLATAELRNIQLSNHSATQIPAAESSYDLVFDYQVFHHIDDWPEAIREVHRVMKPNAQLLIAESLPGLIEDSWWGRRMDHPKENRFTAIELQSALQSIGFKLSQSRIIGDHFIWLVATKA